ncbi:hypothetical protein WH96_05675 [Kiloniella spongiae]|uniref:DUF1499 domain-containing protein n=1 Tax=Kiloniella spongiae TaxID=1489064 RepID=A0A0H2MHV2_9PROT|nr:DUF1499 domain-containing protein [Kiloniella spongiae]KLN61781.1 hypothetical protein WH96_05675 [Kiloniella spongiae]
MMFLKVFMGLLVGICFLIVVGLIFIGRDRGLELVFGPVEEKKVDFATLSLAPTPNQFLVCPKKLCQASAHRESPVYNLSVDELKAEWLAFIKKQPRTEPWIAPSAELGDLETVVDDENLQYDFIQRSEWMRYPDSITIRFIPLGSTTSTLAIYSRSHYGKSDFGVNEQRITNWLSQMSG